MGISRRRVVKHFSAAGMAALTPKSLTPSQTPSKEEVTSPHPIEPVPIEQVVMEDGFWTPKRNTWRSVTLWDCFNKFEESRGDILANFDRVRDGLTGGHSGAPWHDGLIYEMIRAGADFLRANPDPDLQAKLDSYVERICAAAAVDPGGYVNTYTQLQEPSHRWGLDGGLQVWQHEFYNLGALVDAGVHYYRATGSTRLLDAGVRVANTISDLVGPEPGKNLVPAHELPEEAMLGLYELLQEQSGLVDKLQANADPERYLRLAEFWIENRGRNSRKPEWDKDRAAAEKFVREYVDYAHGRPSWGEYAQDHKPVFEQEAIVGHAVRATLMCSALAALARVNRRDDYLHAALRLWESMTYRRMHVTGGVGAFSDDERFGDDYVLPNDAYLETCAAVGAAFFHANMNRTFGHARYADELERVLYNGALCGVSLQGDSYTYTNPLVADKSRERWSWHDCPCCPPMFLKLMGALPGLIYATDAESLYVNLYVGGDARTNVAGSEVVIKQITRYPWDQSVLLSISPEQPTRFGLMLRIPSWCHGATLMVNGQDVPLTDRIRGYTRIERTWKADDLAVLNLPMPARIVKPDPRVAADTGRAAIMRGPIVYCVESTDNARNWDRLDISEGEALRSQEWEDRLGGIVAVRGRGVTAIPFYANANRGPVDMAVWLPLRA